jgi:hypothetical protein
MSHLGALGAPRAARRADRKFDSVNRRVEPRAEFVQRNAFCGTVIAARIDTKDRVGSEVFG